MIGNLPETKWRGFCLRNPQGNPQKSAGKSAEIRRNTLSKTPIKNPYQKSQAIRRNTQKYAETPYQKPQAKTVFLCPGGIN